MKSRSFNPLLVVSLFLFSSLLLAEELPLAPRYSEWVNLTKYIITPKEKAVFKELRSDRERDDFIELFWQQRDPTPGTLQNEYKEEHLRRFAYANKYLQHGSSREGWKTDRGRMYIILGEPENRETIDGSILYPMEVWTYRSQPRLGFKTDFRVVFYRKGGLGEYRIYDPFADGPNSLLATDSLSIPADVDDYKALYGKIYAVNPLAAEVSLSLIPGSAPPDPNDGGSSNPTIYLPKTQGSFLLADIEASPYKRVKTTYATNFANLKGVVDVNVAMEYVECASEAVVFQDPATGLLFLHFALQPEKISVDYVPERGEYYFAFQMSVSLQKEGAPVYQYSRTYPFFLDKKGLERLSAGFAIEDMFPVLAGKYVLTVLIRNTVKEEFSSFEREITVEENEGQGFPRLYGPLVSSQITKKTDDNMQPFRFGETSVKAAPKGEFDRSKPLTVFFSADTKGFDSPLSATLTVQEQASLKVVKSLPLAEIPPDSLVYREAPIGTLPPGSYRLSLTLLSKGIPLQVKESSFSVSSKKNLPEPGSLSKMVPMTKGYFFYYIAGGLAKNLGEEERGKRLMKKAWDLSSDKAGLAEEYGKILLDQGDCERALEVIEHLSGVEAKRFDYLSLKGQCQALLGRDQEAITTLLEANKIYNSDILVLNTLGRLFLKVGEREEAAKALRASLKLKKEQPLIEELLKDLP